jgi:type I restriction-modification system DNA methylase subunit
MAKYELTATEEILDVLKRSTIDDVGLLLPEQLDRTTYMSVNKFLEVSGTKWNKKLKKHIFADVGAKEKILALLDTGSIVDEKKKFQEFYTPEIVAAEIVELAKITPEMIVLEPSAGEGAFVKEILRFTYKVFAVEINPRSVEILRKIPSIDPQFVFEEDFLSYNLVDVKFDKIIMNPPFTEDQDIKHITHAYQFLKSGGELFSIMSPGFTFGSTKNRKGFKKLVEDHGEIVKEYPEGTFKDSGTNVRTVLVKLTKE